MFVREYLLPLIENIYIVKITFVGTGTQFAFLAGPSIKDLENWIYCRSLIKVKFFTDRFRPALGSGGWLIDCHHAQKTSKLPCFRLFPDTQILSALTALYWPSTAFYWPSTTKYQPVPSYTDPAPSWIKHYRLILIQCHQVPTSRAPYWLGGSKKPKYENSKSTLQFLVAFCFLITKI